jgi:predicted lipoprotein with Yx(FWY)xxD motif
MTVDTLAPPPADWETTRDALHAEHFDYAIAAGDDAAGSRANYGGSPGDSDHAEPYLYVGPWQAREGALWNATAFHGAELGLSELLRASEPRRAALDFFLTRARAGEPLMRRLTAAALATVALAACGGDEQAATARAASLAAEQQRGGAVGVRSTRYGRILVDGKGFALYRFTSDGTGPSTCYSECAETWPPLITKGKPRALKGARASLLGTVRRRHGKRQVTYKGQPLYYWYGDRQPGDVECHDVFEFGGTWLVLRPTGEAVD